MRRFWVYAMPCVLWATVQCAPEPTTSQSPRRGTSNVCENCDVSDVSKKQSDSDLDDRAEVFKCQPYEKKQDDVCVLMSFADLCSANLSTGYKQTLRIITEALKTGRCEVTAQKLETLDELHLVGPKTGSSGIGTLSRSENQILDVGPLATLTHLKVLNLQNHQIKDWTPLIHLGELEELYLGFNNISDIRGLVLPKLRKLDLRGNKIIDATPLANFFSLGSGIPEGKGLDMRDNPLGNSIEKTSENCPSGQESPSPLKRFCLT
ncbi:MAG: leucine-rich repeat domain-containing protein [Oligoflexales bacterium]